VHWWLYEYYQSGGAVLVVSWVFWVIFSIVLHELSHGWAALWQGDHTPRTTGHMTWNPLVHMPPMSLLMFLVIGITWGLMPVDPGNFRWKRKGRVVVAAAGPAMNIALFTVAIIGLILWIRLGPGPDENPDLAVNVLTFLETGALLNLVLAIFNLLPLPPLDGSEILSGLSLKWYIWSRNPTFQQVGFFVLLVIFVSGAGAAVWWAAGWVVAAILDVFLGLGAG
jgi:Zn-dependent protease